jgi:Ala-tRNA(Pro) deacylase
VLQATRHVDFARAAASLGARHVGLVSELDLADIFHDCELGAVPPFGPQYGLKTIIDEALTDDEYIVFDGNTHREAIAMRLAELIRIERPRIAALSLVPARCR